MTSPTHSEFMEFLKLAIQTQSDYKIHIKRKLKAQGIALSYENFQVLVILWHQDGVNQQELANQLHKDKATLTYLLDGLAKKQLITRAEDPKDRRNKIITLTQLGRETEAKVMPVVNELFAVACQGITSEELQTIVGLYQKVNNNLQSKEVQ